MPQEVQAGKRPRHFAQGFLECSAPLGASARLRPVALSQRAAASGADAEFAAEHGTASLVDGSTFNKRSSGADGKRTDLFEFLLG